MIRHRRRFATMAHAAPYLALAGVTVLSLSNWTSSAPGAGGSSEPSSSYLYDAPDSIPVLDHGRSGSDFLRSTAPKVVEFYDPKCGACRAFAPNYVEVAKKVRATSNPAVEFYGVSCEVYAALCAGYGGSTVPKIVAFPDGEDNSPAGGTEVPKGAGTVHFLAGRLAKALRTPEEVAADGEKLAESEPKRRLLEEWSGGEGFTDGDEGEGVAESDDPDDDADDGEGDDDAASADEDEPSENTPSEDPDDEEEGVAEAEEDGSDSQEVDDSASDKDERRSYAGQGRPKDFPHNKNRGRIDLERDESGDVAERFPKRKSEEFQHERTDAYRNTMKHFETIDIQKGKPVGYHYQKMKDDREKEVQKKKGERGHPQRAPEEKTNHYLAIKQEVEERERRQRSNAQRNEREGFDSTGEARGQTRDARRPDEDEAISKRERTHRNDQEKRDEFDNKLRANQEMRERLGMGDQQKASQRGQPQGQNKDVQIDDSRGAAAQRREDPRQPKRPSTDGAPRYAKSVFEQKDGDDQIDDSRGAAAQRREDPRRPAREDKPDTDGAPRYAKSVFEPKDQSPFPRKAHTGPVSLPDVNNRISQERGERPAKRPAGGNGIQRQEQPRQVPPPPPREQIPVGGDASVPNPLETDPVRAQKFQEYVARRKQTLERKEKMKHPIKAILGDGTPIEGDTTTNMHKKKSPMNNYKSQMNAKPNRPDLRPEAQRKTVGEKVMRKIPIVKRAFQRSKGEETLNDAALSFARGLLMGAFKTNAALDYKRKAALTDWLDLLRVSIPPEVGLHRLLDTLRYSIDSVSERRENLVAVVEEHPLPDREWSQSCKKGSRGGGFFCGFWKLLHVMSVGFAEQGGGLALRDSSPNIRVFSPKEAGDVVREYMAYFFNCDKCSKRFIAQYDDCSFQRCTRLTDETDISAESWQEFPLWLWQVHNDISRSKINRADGFHNKEGRRAEAKKWEQDMNVVYPLIGQCLKCVTSSGTWDLNAVYHHLENEYWTFGHVVDAKVDQLLDHGIERGNVSFGLGTYAFVTVIMLIALYAKKHRLRVTGRHKKVEADAGPSPFGRTPKYRDS
ncbi:hypothetical protein ACHAWF_013812 [Thalassiosira exigua]